MARAPSHPLASRPRHRCRVRGEVRAGVLLAGAGLGALLTAGLAVLSDADLVVRSQHGDAPQGVGAQERSRATEVGPPPAPQGNGHHPRLVLQGAEPPTAAALDRVAELEARLGRLEALLGAAEPVVGAAPGLGARIARLEHRLDASGLPDPDPDGAPAAWQSADHIARELGLEPNVRAEVEEIVAVARHDLEQVLGTKGEDGVSPFEAARTTIDADGGMRVQIFGWNPRVGVLLASRIPGQGETYLEAQVRIAQAMRAALRRTLPREAWERYAAVDDGRLLPVLEGPTENDDAGED